MLTNGDFLGRLNARKAARDKESSMFNISKALKFKTQSSQEEATGSIDHDSVKDARSISTKHTEVYPIDDEGIAKTISEA